MQVVGRFIARVGGLNSLAVTNVCWVEEAQLQSNWGPLKCRVIDAHRKLNLPYEFKHQES